jgi:heptaprenyl diphosphate synthase
VLHARASTDPADAELKKLLAGPVTEPAALERALELLRSHPAMQLAQQQTLQTAREAGDLLDGLEDGPAVAALRSLVDGVALRST